ncbi:MAG: hypothetical protein JWQ42_556 [Edaphobacter sp.]|nr:hypothetical protein [Edaphobacter sp.]
METAKSILLKLAILVFCSCHDFEHGSSEKGQSDE